MSFERIQKGQNESNALVAATIANVFGTDTGYVQKRDIAVTIIGAGTVYFKIITYTATLTSTVSSTDYTASGDSTTTANGPMQFRLAPDQILVAISAGTPTLNVMEQIYVC